MARAAEKSRASAVIGSGGGPLPRISSTPNIAARSTSTAAVARFASTGGLYLQPAAGLAVCAFRYGCWLLAFGVWSEPPTASRLNRRSGMRKLWISFALLLVAAAAVGATLDETYD